jgi:eukaryotic-like serine/threonine-protein kinase
MAARLRVHATEACDDARTSLVALAPGECIGPYEIQSLLGAGGMGEVYRGRDTRLGRDVALKVIAPRLAGDPGFRRRFELEARAASVLNHPSIVTIYDVGESGGRSWIAMEWVEGLTLRHVLSDGSLPEREACLIARQIAEGLAAAHAKGIVHRDLKPENVMIAVDGRAKILDFGLARQSVGETLEGASGVETVTAGARATQAGSILGTVGYMSPEQAAGRPVDFRSDQFAVGLLAYEMLTGRQAFERPTAVETLSAIIRDEPVPIASVRSGIAEPVQCLVARCLAKRPEDRFDSTRDLAELLRAIEQASSADSAAGVGVSLLPAPSSAVKSRLSRNGILLAASVVVLGAILTGWIWSLRSPANAVGSLAVLPFENANNDPDTAYLGEGLSDALISQMSQATSLRVMASGTVSRFRGTSNPQEVGRQLGVGAVVTGRVTRRADRLTISAELIDIETGTRVWGETYDAPFADVLRVQDAIAANISEKLRLRLSGDQQRTLTEHGTSSADAYELWLRGRYLLTHDTEEDDAEARRLFEQALEKDPKFADAHVEIAATYIRSMGNLYAPPMDAWARAMVELKKALAIDPDNFRARVSLAARRFLLDWDWSGTEREYRQLASDPRLFLSNSYHPIVIFLAARGRPDEAAALLERALRVDPANLESQIMLGDVLVHAGRLDDAVAQYRSIARAAPDDARPLFGLADVLKRRGDIGGAIETLRKAYELSGEEAGTQALAAARTEDAYERAEVTVARARLAELERLAKERYVSPLDIARLQAQVGDRERAFGSLYLALAERSPGLIHLKLDRAWDGIRDDRRFAALVGKVGIP